MQILTTEQRQKLLDALSTAPDEILIDAVRQKKDWHVGIQDSFKEIQGYAGMKAYDTTKPPFAAKAETETPTPAEPVSSNDIKYSKPPGTACSRIGGETKEHVLAKCLKPSTLEEVNKHLGRGAGKLEDTKSLLKLLWERGDLLYSEGKYVTKK